MPFFNKPNLSCDWLKGKWIFVADGFFGDNGKGKITNFLAYYLKEVLGLGVGLCMRPNGGANAGHEVTNPYGRGRSEGSYVGNLTPMAILQGVPALVGPGAVIKLNHFFGTELPRLNTQGIDIEKVFISRKTHITLPHYELIEEKMERIRAVGTTRMAIGVTYEFRANRFGITVDDVLGDDRSLREKIHNNICFSMMLLPHNEDPVQLSTNTLNYLMEYRDRLAKMAVDEQELYRQIREQGQVGIAEMGQGTGLDNIHGSYPYVTSSLTTIPGGLAQAGLSHRDLGYGVLVVKGPYWTRVGEGPFPTEFPAEEAEMYRKIGREYGTTTGRPRRCGYPDLPFLVKAIELNSPDCLCLTKMDIAGPQSTMLQARNIYGYDAKIVNWPQSEVLGKTDYNKLPPGAQYLIDFYSRQIRQDIVHLISTGPSLEDMIINDDFLKKP